MGPSTWFRFLRDYCIGLFRNNKQITLQTFSTNADASKTYFSKIDPNKYVKHHTSLNSELFIDEVSVKIQSLWKPNSRVVDLGAGFCDLEASLQNNLPENCRIIASDYQLHMLRFGRAKVKEGNVLYLAADVEFCPLADDCADLVICINVVPYLDSPKSLAAESHRLLKKDGMLLLVQPVRNPYWEEEFEGVKLNFLIRENTIKIFSDLHFSLVGNYDFRFFFIPMFRLLGSTYAKMLVFQKL